MMNCKVGDLISVMTKNHGFLTGIALKTYPHKSTKDGSPETYIKVIKIGPDYLNFKGKNWSRKGVSDFSGYYVHGEDVIVSKVPCTTATHKVYENYHFEESECVSPSGLIESFTRNKKIPGYTTEVMTNFFTYEGSSFIYVIVNHKGFFGISDVSSFKTIKELTKQAYARSEINRLSREV